MKRGPRKEKRESSFEFSCRTERETSGPLDSVGTATWDGGAMVQRTKHATRKAQREERGDCAGKRRIKTLIRKKLKKQRGRFIFYGARGGKTCKRTTRNY